MSADGLDLYRILQVDPAAHEDVIKAAYRVLARRYHPDLTGDDRVMKRLNSAWEVLSVPERRREYDRERARRLRPASPSHASGAAGPASAATDTIITPAPVRVRPADHAGPPPGNPVGRVLTFSRYEGWSLGEIARADPRFLEWLRTVPAGRGIRDEIDEVLRAAKRPRGLDGRADIGERRPFEPAAAR